MKVLSQEMRKSKAVFSGYYDRPTDDGQSDRVAHRKVILKSDISDQFYYKVDSERLH